MRNNMVKMNDEDIQDSIRLLRLYQHLPKKNLEEIDSLIVLENIRGVKISSSWDIAQFKYHTLAELVTSDEKDIIRIFTDTDITVSRLILHEVAKQMKIYLATRQEVIEENIHWTF